MVLAAVCEDVTAKCFMEVDEKAEACANRLEKQADKMNLILARHSEETKPIGFKYASMGTSTAERQKISTL